MDSVEMLRKPCGRQSWLDKPDQSETRRVIYKVGVYAFAKGRRLFAILM